MVKREGVGRREIVRGTEEVGKKEGGEEEGEKEKEVKLTLVLGGEKAYRGVKRPLGWKNMVTKSAEKEERKEMREKEKEERKKARETRKKVPTLPAGCANSSPTIVASIIPSDTSSHSYNNSPPPTSNSLPSHNTSSLSPIVISPSPIVLSILSSTSSSSNSVVSDSPCLQTTCECVLDIGMLSGRGFHGANKPDDEDRVARVKSAGFWWGEYEKNSRIAKYHTTVKRTIGAMKRWLVLMNVPLMSRLKAPQIEDLIVLAVFVNWQLESGSFTHW